MNEPIPLYLKRPTAIILKRALGSAQEYYVRQSNTYQLDKKRGDLGRWNIYYKPFV